MPYSNITGRLERLERALHVGDTHNQAAQRAYLAEQFADAKYDAHREALIEALLSDNPHYRMEFPTELHGHAATETHFISWANCDEGAPVIHIWVMPDREDDPYPLDS